eukprot:CAMPEP_0116971930 /NCGR_PEP_ID=MMETSP0467-20121206/53520_1 /TAXON_ID=283647 /ORGANISM="Mesodinium pulex, Strain SPMC105" /LENGTH=35 /DNA_ID= /DNA_START= /DNA_END= /DNA_ORIENTATION=
MLRPIVDNARARKCDGPARQIPEASPGLRSKVPSR